MCVCVCVYSGICGIITFLNACIYTYTHTYTYIYVCIYSYLYICRYVYMYIYISLYVYIERSRSRDSHVSCIAFWYIYQLKEQADVWEYIQVVQQELAEFQHTTTHTETHCNILQHALQPTLQHALQPTLQHTRRIVINGPARAGRLQHTATHRHTHYNTHCNTYCNTHCSTHYHTHCNTRGE